MFCFIQYTSSIYFLFFRVFFLDPQKATTTVSDSFFFLPHLLSSCRRFKGIKDGRKKIRIPLDLNSILEVYDFSVVKNVFLNQ